MECQCSNCVVQVSHIGFNLHQCFYCLAFLFLETCGIKAKCLNKQEKWRLVSLYQINRELNCQNKLHHVVKKVPKQTQKQNYHRHQTVSEEAQPVSHNTLWQQTMKQDDILVPRKSIQAENDGTEGYFQSGNSPSLMQSLSLSDSVVTRFYLFIFPTVSSPSSPSNMHY